jgi:hypothetical protein
LCPPPASLLRQILYTKAVQTSFYSSEDDADGLPAHMANGVGSSTSTGPPRESEDAMRKRIIKELEDEKAALDKQIEEERATLAKEVEQDRLRGQSRMSSCDGLQLAFRLTTLARCSGAQSLPRSRRARSTRPRRSSSLSRAHPRLSSVRSATVTTTARTMRPAGQPTCT